MGYKTFDLFLKEFERPNLIFLIIKFFYFRIYYASWLFSAKLSISKLIDGFLKYGTSKILLKNSLLQDQHIESMKSIFTTERIK